MYIRNIAIGLQTIFGYSLCICAKQLNQALIQLNARLLFKPLAALTTVISFG